MGVSAGHGGCLVDTTHFQLMPDRMEKVLPGREVLHARYLFRRTRGIPSDSLAEKSRFLPPRCASHRSSLSHGPHRFLVCLTTSSAQSPMTPRPKTPLASPTRPNPTPTSHSPERKFLPGLRELPQLMPHHLLAHHHWQIILPIMHHEPQPDEVGHDGACAGFGVDRGVVLQRGGEGGECGEVGAWGGSAGVEMSWVCGWIPFHVERR